MHHVTSTLRQDITGLRAVAVLAVTLYHIAHVLVPDNNYFKGGFLGVDIFFVISGYLMTKIIMTGLDKGNFSLYTFYKRRAKRICPALFVTVIVFVVAALLVLDTETLLKTCRDGLRALGFISNYWLARQTGYFDGAATERLFLHTWSLSVEWQFYLVYPLLLMLAAKLVSRKMLGAILVLLTLSSLIYGCVYTFQNPVNSYFFLTSRAYELLIGALAYFYPLSFFLKLVKAKKEEVLDAAFQEKVAKQVEYLGLLCIAVSLVVVDSTSGWPNPWSILPLLGTYLCIAAENKQTLLSNVVFQKLGLWSYAIYLVHWPVIVLCGYFARQSVAWELLPLILVLGVALHYGVDRRRNFGWVFFIGYFALAGSVQWLITTDAMKIRDVKLLILPSGTDVNNTEAHHIGDLSRPVDFILTGDSYSRHYVASIEKQGLHVITVLRDGCFSAPKFYARNGKIETADNLRCKTMYSRALKEAKKHPGVPVLWSVNWPQYSNWWLTDSAGQLRKIDVAQDVEAALPLFVQDLAESKNRLYIIGKPRAGDANVDSNMPKKCYPLRIMDNILTSLLMKYLDCKEVAFLAEPEINVELKAIIGKLSQEQSNIQDPVVFIDPYKAYCSEQGCRLMMPATYEPLFFDGGHFSEYGADPALKYIVDQLKNTEANYNSTEG